MAQPPPPPNLSYASMLEEKSLRKTFLITTLISAVLGSFTTAMNLQDRVSEKRRSWKQEKTDKKQNEAIEKLERRLDKRSEKGGSRKRIKDDEDSLATTATVVDEEDLRDSLAKSGPMIQKEFEAKLSQMGNRFADGDLIAQTQLQSQVISLQTTVIEILQEALFDGKQPDVSRLFKASELARNGCIKALQDQYQRMLQSIPDRSLQPPRPSAPLRRTSSDTMLNSRYRSRAEWDRDSDYSGSSGHSPDRRRQRRHSRPHSGPLVAADEAGYGITGGLPLFCRYAESLQRHGRRPLDADAYPSVGPPRFGPCPGCNTVINLSTFPREIVNEVVLERRPRNGYEFEELVEERVYQLSDRFIVKCHRAGQGFACCLCEEHRDAVVLCESAEALAEHIKRRHEIREYESDPDIRDISGRPPLCIRD